MTRLKDLAQKCQEQTDKGDITALQLVKGYDNSFAQNTEGVLKGITALSFTDEKDKTFKKLVLGEDAQALEYLYLSGNTALKELVFETALPNLTHLYVDGCDLTELVVPAGCTALQQLYVQKQANKLKTLVFQGDCPALQLLDVSDNDLTAFTLPVLFKQMTYLYLKGNDGITNIPKEIYQNKTNSWADVSAYLGEFIKGTILNERAKLIIVGNGRVGKTSMFRCLDGQSLNPNEKYTHGIQIGNLDKKALPEVKTDKLQLNVWDFGGQEIFYAAHQFFLTEEAVYILAWTKEANVIAYRQRDEAGLTFEDSFRESDYWLENIRLHGKQSPILMVQTHYDCSKNRLPTESRYEEDFRVIPLNFSAATKFNLEGLKALIAEKLNDNIRGYGQEIAKTYATVIEKIEVLQSEGSKRINLAQFNQLCTEAEIERGSETAVLNYLNQIGLVVYFDKQALKETVFIDPNWLTHQVYRLINKNLTEDGKIDAAYLAQQLPEYTPQEREQLMELLESFKLVFKAQKENFYIAPQYLPTQLTGFAKSFFDSARKRATLGFVFRFSKFMPDNVMINFISHYGPYSDNAYWKSGIYFTDDKSNVECIVALTNLNGIKSLHVYTTQPQTPDSQSLQKSIFDAFIELSKNVAADLSLDGTTFVSWQALLDNADDVKDNPNHYFRYDGNKIYLKDYALFLGREHGFLLEKERKEGASMPIKTVSAVQSLKKQVLKLIGQAKIDKAIEVIEEWAFEHGDTAAQNGITLIKSAWALLNEGINDGTAINVYQERAALNKRILNFDWSTDTIT